MALQTDYPLNPPLAYEGMIIGPLEDCDFHPVRNADTVSIPFGRAVAWKKVGQTADMDVQLPASSTDTIAGIFFKVNYFMPALTVPGLGGAPITIGQFDSNGLLPGQMFVILRRGKIAVRATEFVNVDDRPFVMIGGGFRRSADGTNTIDCTRQGQFLSSGPPGTFLQLSVDFLSKP